MMISVTVALCVLVLMLILYLRRRNGYFRRYNIPFPKPRLVFGNLLDVKDKTFHEVIQEWSKKYGKVFGYIEGGQPVLVVSDLDILQEVFVTRFNTFHSRKVFPLQGAIDTNKGVHLFIARGARWKRLRAIISPTFSAAKIKQMTTLMNECIDILMKKLEENESRDFDIYPFYQGLTMDVIGRCAFGFVSDCQRDEADEFLNLCRAVMQDQVKKTLLASISIIFPELDVLWRLISDATALIWEPPFAEIGRKLRPIIDYRRAHPDEAMTTVDLLQLLLDAESEDVELVADDAAKRLGKEAPIGKSESAAWTFEKRLTTEEIIQQCIIFLIAGFETTSAALAYVTYLLALNPDVQEKLQQEVDMLFTEEGQKKPKSLDDSAAKQEYMEQVMKETLRLYPIASTPWIESRTCMKDCTINGVFIPAGLTVCADVWSIHYNADIWGDEPEKFKPERWAPQLCAERHSLSWLPFGVGPRSCIGKRFAMLEEKLALTRILRSYSFRLSTRLQVPLKFKEGVSTTPIEGVFVRLERRVK